jgi:predicted ATP-binding protein involved in virulence
MRILRRLRSAFPNVQFIITTHDPLSLRGAYDGEVCVLERSAFNDVDLLTDLPNVQGMTVEQLLASDCFGLLSTEDPIAELEMIRYTALASRDARSSEDEAELAELRNRIHERTRLGSTPEAQLIYDSAREYVSKRQRLGVERRMALKQRTLDEMADIWNRSRREDQES